MNNTLSNEKVEIATMWCEVIHAINEADKTNMEVGEFIPSVLEPQFEIRRKPVSHISEEEIKILAEKEFPDEPGMRNFFFKRLGFHAGFKKGVSHTPVENNNLLKDENENLKKQLREQIAGAAMQEQSLLELNRKIKENTIDKIIQGCNERLDYHEGRDEDYDKLYFRGNLDAFKEMKQFLESLK